MSQAPNECVLLIECQPAEARLITDALTNYVHGPFAVESSIKFSDGLQRIAKGGDNIGKSLKHRVGAEGRGDRGATALSTTRRMQRRARA